MRTTYQPQSKNADKVHEDMATVAENSSIKRNEWLRGTEAEESVRVRLKGTGQLI
jgi:hypothetical protein